MIGKRMIEEVGSSDSMTWWREYPCKRYGMFVTAQDVLRVLADREKQFLGSRVLDGLLYEAGRDEASGCLISRFANAHCQM